MVMAAERIIIIDDDEPFTEAAALLLQDQGYEVLRALTGENGIAKSVEKRPDLVIIDVHLPDLNGVRVAQKIRHAHPSMPLIMISSDDSRETVTSCLALNSCSFLPKPLVPETLITAIADALDESDGSR